MLRGPKDHRSTRILRTMVSGSNSLSWALEPGRRILIYLPSLGPLTVNRVSRRTVEVGK